MISSFYGGRKGTDLAVVQIFNNLQELANDLKNPTNSQVEFEDYVLISYGPPIPSQDNSAIMKNSNWEADISTIEQYPHLKDMVYLNYFNGTLWQKVLGDSLTDEDNYISWPLDKQGGIEGTIVYKLVSSLVVLPDLQINLGENQENEYVPSIYKTPAKENSGILDLGYSLELPDLYKGQGTDIAPEGAKQGDYYLDLNTGLFYQFGEEKAFTEIGGLFVEPLIEQTNELPLFNKLGEEQKITVEAAAPVDEKWKLKFNLPQLPQVQSAVQYVNDTTEPIEVKTTFETALENHCLKFNFKINESLFNNSYFEIAKFYPVKVNLSTIQTQEDKNNIGQNILTYFDNQINELEPILLIIENDIGEVTNEYGIVEASIINYAHYAVGYYNADNWDFVSYAPSDKSLIGSSQKPESSGLQWIVL